MSDAIPAAEASPHTPGPLELELWQLELRYAALRITHREQHKQLVASVLEHGQKVPVIVVADEHPDRYVLIDGYGRVAALRELGRDTARALVMPLQQADALVVSYRLDTGRRRTVLEEGWLVRELVETLGMRLFAVSVELGHSKSWVSRRLALVRDLPESVQELVRSGRLAAHTAMQSLVPLSRGNQESAEVMARVAVREKLSSRQTAALCRAWTVASDAQREQLLERPVEYLRTQEAVDSAQSLRRTPSEQPLLVRDFDSLTSISRRAEGVLRGYGSEGEQDVGETEALIVAWPRAREAFSALSRRVQEKLDAGSGYQESDLTAEP
jgi:ParB/RepB/Spo0J family partition protein